jgi:hypothetical protein
MRSIGLVALFLMLTGCLLPQPVSTMTTQCTQPRPQVCTMEYAPVCANLVAGGRKESSSACNACADDAVASYLSGPCPE